MALACCAAAAAPMALKLWEPVVAFLEINLSDTGPDGTHRGEFMCFCKSYKTHPQARRAVRAGKIAMIGDQVRARSGFEFSGSSWPSQPHRRPKNQNPAPTLVIVPREYPTF